MRRSVNVEMSAVLNASAGSAAGSNVSVSARRRCLFRQTKKWKQAVHSDGDGTEQPRISVSLMRSAQFQRLFDVTEPVSSQ